MYNQPSWNCNWRGKPNARKAFVGMTLYWTFDSDALMSDSIFFMSLGYIPNMSFQKKLLSFRIVCVRTHIHFFYMHYDWIPLYWNFLIKWNLVTFSHILMGTKTYLQLKLLGLWACVSHSPLVTFNPRKFGVLYHHGNIKPDTLNTSWELRALKEQFSQSSGSPAPSTPISCQPQITHGF